MAVSPMRIEEVLKNCLNRLHDSRVKEAMSYSLLAGGKRIRPNLLYETLKGYGKQESCGDEYAAAIEMIHTYSLIHDDLPAMDNDDLRRGEPTNHVKFGAGMATLAGDGLLTLAFQWLTDNELPIEVQARLTLALAKAAGPSGMVAGQARDIEGEGKHLKLAELQYLHRQKTGALLKYAVQAGGIITEQPAAVIELLGSFGAQFGLAFQIYDDIMDVVATPEQMGKATHKDAAEHKNTYPGLLGLDGAKEQLQKALDQAIEDQDQLAKLTGRSMDSFDQFLAYFKL